MVGKDCIDSCCIGWNIPIDKTHLINTKIQQIEKLLISLTLVISVCSL